MKLIKKIISGGQTGADIAGVKAGYDLKLKTGGYCPANYKTDEGSNKELIKYNIKCTKSNTYPPRTRMNIASSDATLSFGNSNSPGMKLTRKLCQELDKPYYHIKRPISIFEFYTVREWIHYNNINILNIAGNRERSSPGIENEVYTFLMELLK